MLLVTAENGYDRQDQQACRTESEDPLAELGDDCVGRRDGGSAQTDPVDRAHDHGDGCDEGAYEATAQNKPCELKVGARDLSCWGFVHAGSVPQLG